MFQLFSYLRNYNFYVSDLQIVLIMILFEHEVEVQKISLSDVILLSRTAQQRAIRVERDIKFKIRDSRINGELFSKMKQ